MCVVADTDNKVGRTKIDPIGKISLFVGYSTQHAGDVYRLLNPKPSRVIHSRDVKWTGKTWAEFYKTKMIDRLQGMLTQMKIYNLKKMKTKMNKKKSWSLKKMNQRSFKLVNHRQKNKQRPQLVWLMMSQWLQVQEAKLQQVNQLQQEQDKHYKTLNGWLHEIPFVTSTMSDPDE